MINSDQVVEGNGALELYKARMVGAYVPPDVSVLIWDSYVTQVLSWSICVEISLDRRNKSPWGSFVVHSEKLSRISQLGTSDYSLIIMNKFQIFRYSLCDGVYRPSVTMGISPTCSVLKAPEEQYREIHLLQD